MNGMYYDELCDFIQINYPTNRFHFSVEKITKLIPPIKYTYKSDVLPQGLSYCIGEEWLSEIAEPEYGFMYNVIFPSNSNMPEIMCINSDEERKNFAIKYETFDRRNDRDVVLNLVPLMTNFDALEVRNYKREGWMKFLVNCWQGWVWRGDIGLSLWAEKQSDDRWYFDPLSLLMETSLIKTQPIVIRRKVQI